MCKVCVSMMYICVCDMMCVFVDVCACMRMIYLSECVNNSFYVNRYKIF